METQKVTVYIDGACKGNPGPGKSLAVFEVENGGIFSRDKNFEDTTNNRAEYEALILALEEILIELHFLWEADIDKTLDIVIYTDSQLIVGHLTKGWKVNKNNDLVSRAKRLVDEIRVNNKLDIKYIQREYNKAGIILEKEG